MDFVSSQIIGFLFGLATSFASWWVLFHYLSPKIRFADQILKKPVKVDAENILPHKYLIRFANVGNRVIYEVNVKAMTCINGRYSNLTIYGYDEYPIFAMRSSKTRQITWTLLLTPEKSQSYVKNAFYAGEIREKREKGILNLEDVLRHKKQDSPEVFIYISGVDGYSGAKKYFMKRYFLEDIIEGSAFKSNAFEVDISPEA